MWKEPRNALSSLLTFLPLTSLERQPLSLTLANILGSDSFQIFRARVQQSVSHARSSVNVFVDRPLLLRHRLERLTAVRAISTLLSHVSLIERSWDLRVSTAGTEYPSHPFSRRRRLRLSSIESTAKSGPRKRDGPTSVISRVRRCSPVASRKGGRSRASVRSNHPN